MHTLRLKKVLLSQTGLYVVQNMDKLSLCTAFQCLHNSQSVDTQVTVKAACLLVCHVLVFYTTVTKRNTAAGETERK